MRPGSRVASRLAPTRAVAGAARRDIPVGLYTGGRSHPALRLITAELANRIDGARLLDVPRQATPCRWPRTSLSMRSSVSRTTRISSWDERGSVARADADGE